MGRIPENLVGSLSEEQVRLVSVSSNLLNKFTRSRLSLSWKVEEEEVPSITSKLLNEGRDKFLVYSNISLF